MLRLTLSVLLICTIARAGSLDTRPLEAKLTQLTKGFDGRVGVCVQDQSGVACVRGGERFSLQSVVKLVVGVAVMDSVDRGKMRINDSVLVRRADLSVFVQPIADLVGTDGYRTTVGDLVRRAIIDSDSAAVDMLIARLGGPAAVQAVLGRKGITGIHVDRDERHLQTEILGLTWKPEYVDPAALTRDRERVPVEKRREAYRKYQADPRDTSTPAGMASLLWRLAKGELLSASSTEFVRKAMAECRTFPDRLKAGVGPGWKIEHKTGTSGSFEGVTAATNDVGILTAPDGTAITVAVFIGDSRAEEKVKAALMARVSAEAINAYR